ncbi:MAG: CoA transferase [Acidimicrobiaceae bacterium]|nr:CoA transferase [Acidimicrobiaceae bacterium]
MIGDAPLDGLRVVEGSAFVAAPSGGMALAQLGAEVVRFDRIGGGIDYGRWPLTAEGRSLYWAGLNKGKKSMAVNLRDPAAHELLTELIGAAGTFLTNFPARGWMAPGRLTARRADLVMVAVTGNRDGTTAVDYTVNAAIGFPMVTGPADLDGPVNSVLPAWDLLCGQTAAVGILAAERRRLLTGEGSVMTLALSDVALAAAAALGYVAEVQVDGAIRPRCGNDLWGAFGVELSTADGRRLYAVGISGRQWASLVEATESEAAVAEIASTRGLDFKHEGDRFEARHEIKAVMQDWAAARPFAEAAERLDALGVCWGPYQTFAELVENDPRCSPAGGLFREVDQPGIGPYLVPGSPLALATGAGPAPDGLGDVSPAPALGQHTDEVLAGWLGLSAGEIGRLHDAGVVAGGSWRSP